MLDSNMAVSRELAARLIKSLFAGGASLSLLGSGAWRGLVDILAQYTEPRLICFYPLFDNKIYYQ